MPNHAALPGKPKVRRSPSPRLALRRAARFYAAPAKHNASSPVWGSTTKLLVGLTIVLVMIVLLASARFILGPILLAVVIAYLTYPLAAWLHRLLRLNWRILVSVVYLLIYLAVLALLAWGGITLFEQVQSLIHFVEDAIQDLPAIMQGWIDAPPAIGPFELNLRQMDVVDAANRLLGAIQPLIGQAGNLVGSVASGTANIIGWLFFSFLLSYFIVSETGGKTEELLRLNLPGYREDIKRFFRELGFIWNAFLRGQLAVFLIVSTTYLFTFSILGVQFFYGLALLAGAGRFVPYLGQWIAWGVSALVAYSQGYSVFGLEQGWYVAVVLLTAVASDGLIDNFISPRIFSNALKIHPAAVLVAAFIGYDLIGAMGIILAAPALATLKLGLDYLINKLFNLDPWGNIVRASPPLRVRATLQIWGRRVFHLVKTGSGWLILRIRALFQPDLRQG